MFNWIKHHLIHKRTTRVKTPRAEYGPLFEAIQKSRLFPDSKTFIDSIPNKDLAAIKRAFKESGEKGDLRQFIEEHFILPEHAGAKDPTDELHLDDIRNYINHTWKVLARDADQPLMGSSLLPLPYPYIVPGGRYREIYYWDSYFSMLGLRESEEIDMIENMVKNFAHFIQTYGFIPNSNRTYYLSRSQPPFFALMVRLLADIRGEKVLGDYLTEMVREYNYWMRGAAAPQFKLRIIDQSEHVVRMPDGEILNRYYDTTNLPREEGFFEDVELQLKAPQPREFYRNIRAATESGWDFSSRWFGPSGGLETTRILNIAPIDLNCILLRVEDIIADTYRVRGDAKNEKLFRQKYTARAATIQKYCWSESERFFFDYSLPQEQLSPHLTLAGVCALYVGLATDEQAQHMANVLAAKFLRHGGLVTTLTKSGEQWDAPNGWAPLQYMAVIGLERYGYHDLAQDIAERWCTLVLQHFKQDNTLLEKYNVEDPTVRATGGEYELQQGFGWTNGVTLYFLNKYDLEE